MVRVRTCVIRLPRVCASATDTSEDAHILIVIIKCDKRTQVGPSHRTGPELKKSFIKVRLARAVLPVLALSGRVWRNNHFLVLSDCVVLEVIQSNRYATISWRCGRLCRPGAVRCPLNRCPTWMDEIHGQVIQPGIPHQHRQRLCSKGTEVRQMTLMTLPSLPKGK